MSELAESVTREAIYAVLSRLGKDNLEMLKVNLKLDFDIELEGDNFYTLEELQIALQRIMGAYGASFLAREIQNEIRLLVDQAHCISSA